MSNRNTVPTYRLLKQSGQGVLTLPDGRGGSRAEAICSHQAAEAIRPQEAIGSRLIAESYRRDLGGLAR